MNRTAIMAIVGGTASELGGGKFSNGAVTAIYVHLFNAEKTVKSIFGFVKHYFGDGSSRNITDEYILSDSAQHKIRSFENKAINYAQKNGSYYGWSQSSTDVTFESLYLFSIGDSSGFYISSSCLDGSCFFTYDLIDSFRDPIDIGIGLPGSKPYKIYGHWTKEIVY